MGRHVTASQISTAIKALTAAGTPPTGVLCRPDGSVAVLTQPVEVELPKGEQHGSWVDMAGEREANDA